MVRARLNTFPQNPTERRLRKSIQQTRQPKNLTVFFDFPCTPEAHGEIQLLRNSSTLPTLNGIDQFFILTGWLKTQLGRPSVLPHQIHKLFKEIIGIVGAGAGFWVVLHREQR